MSKKILLIHHDVHIREDYQDVLELELYDVVGVADNAQEGWDLLESMESLPDLIICEVIMPVMDGYTLLIKLRSSDRYAHLPIMLAALQSISPKLFFNAGLGQKKPPQTIEEFLSEVERRLS